jgi:hypothetical protein
VRASGGVRLAGPDHPVADELLEVLVAWHVKFLADDCQTDPAELIKGKRGKGKRRGKGRLPDRHDHTGAVRPPTTSVRLLGR